MILHSSRFCELMREGEGEVEVSGHFVVLNSDSSSNVQVQPSLSVVDEMLRNAQTCTHTHTCNPPGSDSTHTHTCFHTHVFPSQSENNTDLEEGKPRRRPSGNREAVRKYREKKKAHTAYLEEEVKKLRVMNEQMIKKVQRQVVLEAEVMRLRSVLVKLRDKIDSELEGGFPCQKHCNSATLFKEGDCAVQSSGKAMKNDLQCFNPQAVGSPPMQPISLDNGWGNKMMFSLQHCQPAIADCLNDDRGSKEKSRLHSLVVSSSSHAEYPKE